MIRPLRQRHRWMIPVLALLVTAAVVAALLARPEPPLQEPLPEPMEKTAR